MVDRSPGNPEKMTSRAHRGASRRATEKTFRSTPLTKIWRVWRISRRRFPIKGERADSCDNLPTRRRRGRLAIRFRSCSGGLCGSTRQVATSSGEQPYDYVSGGGVRLPWRLFQSLANAWTCLQLLTDPARPIFVARGWEHPNLRETGWYPAEDRSKSWWPSAPSSGPNFAGYHWGMLQGAFSFGEP